MRVRSKIIATVAGGAVLASAGAAYAFWSKSAGGTGSGLSGDVQALVVHQTSTVTGLAPGLAAQPLSGNFNNPNSGPVYVSSVTATVSGTDKTGCDATDYTIAGTAPVNAQVPSGNNQGAWSGLTIQFNNKGTNQDACKGATVSITYATT